MKWILSSEVFVDLRGQGNGEAKGTLCLNRQLAAIPVESDRSLSHHYCKKEKWLFSLCLKANVNPNSCIFHNNLYVPHRMKKTKTETNSNVNFFLATRLEITVILQFTHSIRTLGAWRWGERTQTTASQNYPQVLLLKHVFEYFFLLILAELSGTTQDSKYLGISHLSNNSTYRKQDPFILSYGWSSVFLFKNVWNYLGFGEKRESGTLNITELSLNKICILLLAPELNHSDLHSSLPSSPKSVK